MTFGRLTIALLAALALAGAGCSSSSTPVSGGYSTITVQELQTRTSAGEKFTIIDLREPELYRAGHIPGARNIPFEGFNDRMNELSPDTKIALVCHSGPMGDISGQLLAERGYANVSNVKGGMAAWNGGLER